VDAPALAAVRFDSQPPLPAGARLGGEQDDDRATAAHQRVRLGRRGPARARLDTLAPLRSDGAGHAFTHGAPGGGNLPDAAGLESRLHVDLRAAVPHRLAVSRAQG